MTRCWNGHAEYDGYECPICALVKATEDAGERIVQATRDASDRDEHHAELQLMQSQRLAHAQYETQEAIHRAADQNDRLARDGWKLQVVSKVQRGLELLNNDMFEEASSILRKALATDPGNLFAHIYLALAERSAGNTSEYWLHMQKGAQLLGTTDYSNVGAYRETITAISVPSGHEKTANVLILRDVLFKKLRAYFVRGPADADISLLKSIVEKKWDEIARLGVGVIDARQLSLDFVQISMKQGCYETAAFAAEKLVEVTAAQKDMSAWLECSMMTWEIKHSVGRGTPEKGIRLLTGWRVEEIASLVDEFVNKRDVMIKSISERAWVSLASALRSYYRQIRVAIYEYLDRTAGARSESSKQPDSVIGAVVSLIVLLILGAISTLFDATLAFAVPIILVAVGAGVVVANMRGTAAREKAFREYQTHLHALQQRIEVAIGLVETPSSTWEASRAADETVTAGHVSPSNEDVTYVYPRRRDPSAPTDR